MGNGARIGIVQMSARKFSISLLLSFLVFFAAPALAQQKPLDGLDALIEKAMKQWRVPGLAIAVVKDDRVLLTKGYGVRTVGKPERVDENTLFAIASNTKAFTATALGILVAEGKIKWDDRVLDYLPAFALPDPVATRKATVRDLLCHRAGLGKWAGDLTSWGSTLEKKKILRRIRFQKPAFDFRTGYGYSNLMFLAAGEIFPVVTKKSWQEFVKERFFVPLEMKRTNTSLAKLKKMDNVATPHLIHDGKVITHAYDEINDDPAGGINSCVKDLANWLLMQLAGGKFKDRRIVDESIIQETRTSHTLVPFPEKSKKWRPETHFITYGLGWFLADYRGRLLVSHGGGLTGMFSDTAMLPEENLGVVVLTNLEDHYLMRAVACHLLDSFLGVESSDWSAHYFRLHQEEKQEQAEKKQERAKARMLGTRTTQALLAYAGTYQDEVYGQAVIRYKNGQLTLRLEHHPGIAGKLKHWHHDVFLCEWSEVTFGESFIHFDFDNDMEIKQFRLKVRPDWVDTREYVFVRSRK